MPILMGRSRSQPEIGTARSNNFTALNRETRGLQIREKVRKQEEL
jgi:hypothetical protein